MLPRCVSGVAMLSDEVQPTDSVPSDKSEETQPKEDPDKIRGEVFKRMFPDVRGKRSGSAKKPAE